MHLLYTLNVTIVMKGYRMFSFNSFKNIPSSAHLSAIQYDFFFNNYFSLMQITSTKANK